jgi:hypothetical protein
MEDCRMGLSDLGEGQWWALVNMVMNIRASENAGSFLNSQELLAFQEVLSSVQLQQMT